MIEKTINETYSTSRSRAGDYYDPEEDKFSDAARKRYKAQDARELDAREAEIAKMQKRARYRKNAEDAKRYDMDRKMKQIGDKFMRDNEYVPPTKLKNEYAEQAYEDLLNHVKKRGLKGAKLDGVDFELRTQANGLANILRLNGPGPEYKQTIKLHGNDIYNSTRGFFGRMMGKVGLEESVTLSSDDIRKMIQEELINVRKENNG